jgi:hypothetical protein
MTESGAPMTDPGRRRTLVVWGVCAALCAYAILLASLAALIYAELSRRSSHGLTVTGSAWANVYVDAGLSVIYAALAYFIYRGVPWARTATIALVGLNLALGVAVVVATRAASGIIGLLPQAALLALLWHRDLRQWCS